jgi:hypothetical protein
MTITIFGLNCHKIKNNTSAGSKVMALKIILDLIILIMSLHKCKKNIYIHIHILKILSIIMDQIMDQFGLFHIKLSNGSSLLLKEAQLWFLIECSFL